MGGMLPRKPSNTQKRARQDDAVPQNVPKNAKSNQGIIKKDKAKSSKRIFRLPKFAKNKILYILIPSLIAFAYLFRLRTFPPEVSDGDTLTNQFISSESIDSIGFLPAKIFLVLASKVGISSETEMRIFSVLVLFFAIFFLYKIMSRWLDRKAGIIAILLFASSSWVLFQSRQDGFSTIMLALIPALLYFGHILIKSKSLLVKILLSLIVVQFIFIPGAVWFFIASAIIMVSFYGKRAISKGTVLAAFLLTSVIAAYAGSIFYLKLNNLSQVVKLVGFEVGQLPSLDTLRTNLTQLPNELFMRGLNDHLSWLYGTPIIDWVSLIFLLSGIMYLAKARAHPVRQWTILIYSVISIMLIAVNGAAYISVLLPLIYIVITMGVISLIKQWFYIFPNNPLARASGTILVAFSLLLIAGYHVERYFIGWPKTDQYKQIFKD